MDVNRTDFQALVQNKDWKNLTASVGELDAIELANLIEEVSDEDGVIIFVLLKRERAKKVFGQLSHEKQVQVFSGLAEDNTKRSNLLNDIEPDDRTAFLGELPPEKVQALMQSLSAQERHVAMELLEYPKESIGRLMTPEFVAVKPQHSIEQAFQNIRHFGKDSETLNVIYIVNDEHKLIDDIRIKALILASPNQRIEDLMDHRFVALNAMDDQESAIRVFMDYDRVALPVVSEEGVLLGIVTIDDILDVVEQESSEDFQKFGSFSEAIANPLKAKILQLYKSRVVWLFALVFMNVFSGAALSSFENVIQSMVSLVFFLPLLIDSGGNAGSQSATLMIRSLAVGSVKISDWYKLVLKEVTVSLLLGVTMAVGVSAVAWFRAPEIIAVVALTMVATVMLGSLIGILLPVIFTRLKLDPATASAPLITSLSDICGVLIYFTIASWFFGY